MNGACMVTVESSAELLERHVDQVRRRDSPVAATSETKDGSSVEAEVDNNEALTTEESVAPMLRHSTRVRKPVQRYP